MEHMCSQCKEITSLADLERAVVDSDGREDLVCQSCVALIIDGAKKLESDPLWWGYRHINGTYQAKRLFSKEDISEADNSPMVEKTFGPFEAKDRDDAINQIQKLDDMITKKLKGGVTDEI